MERLYYDADGNQLDRSDWDIHHPFARSSMRGGDGRKWADKFTLPIIKTFHNLGSSALHNNVPLCPRPCNRLMSMIESNRLLQVQRGETDVYDNFIDMNEYIHRIAETTPNTGLQRNAERVANNLEQQSLYILQGMVVVEHVV